MSAATDRTAALARAVREAHAGDAWHGPALAEALAGFDAASAAARPIAGAHSAWELALHATAWTREVARRLRPDVLAGEPEAGDWPPAPEGAAADEAAWARTRADADRALDECLAAIAEHLAGAPHRLDAIVPRADGADAALSDAALGTRHTYGDMLAGLAAHLAYHAGQLVLLRRALGG
ncbi:MAG TPA: DinB family protein [Gemmatirosa sp.]|nr:DinB family protein [Gemmatirosa sp.]